MNYNMVKLHLCIAEIYTETEKIEKFVDNWDTRSPFSAEYVLIYESLTRIRTLDKMIHDELFPEMIAEYKKEDK